MPLYSNSPLGLVLSSSITAGSNRIGNYNAAAVSSTSSVVVRSLFTQGNNPTQFGYNLRSTTDASDLSTTSIITYLEKYASMKLKFSDFAYLKNLGVYPNNRLIVARRFAGPVDDDLTSITKTPTAALISWVPDNENFISAFDFGEVWEEGEASFKKILNDLGDEILLGDNKGKKLGDFIGGGAGIVPLPGFTEGLQWQVFKSLGISDLDASNFPAGNPNIIKESKRRKLYTKDESSSGLKCKFSIKMSVEYEQKFIDGVDPTVVYYDIIANALTFGTSRAEFLFKRESGGKFAEFINNLASGESQRIKKALTDFIAAISTAVSKIANEILDWFDTTNAKKTNSQSQGNQSEEDKKKLAEQQIKENRDRLQDRLDKIQSLLYKLLGGLVNKYKIRIISVVNALTGSPSAPWHVTIGDPRYPIFSSGDMLVENVSMSMGKLLAFNNLPSSIKLDFTLISARNIGAQEIYNKFSTGQGRTYKKFDLSFVENDKDGINEKDLEKSKQQMKLDALQTDAKINVTSNKDENLKQAQIIGSSVFPKAITQLNSVTYEIDENGNVMAKANLLLRNNTGSLIQPATNVIFEPNGRVIENTTPARPIGSYIILNDGSILLNTSDPRYQNGQQLNLKN